MIRTDFAGARMILTHWVSAQTLLRSDDLRSLPQIFVDAQAAMLPASNQGTWDLLIPAYLGKSSEPPVPQKLTAMMNKARNQRISSVSSVSDKAYAVFPADLPLITINMGAAGGARRGGAVAPERPLRVQSERQRWQNLWRVDIRHELHGRGNLGRRPGATRAESPRRAKMGGNTTPPRANFPSR